MGKGRMGGEGERGKRGRKGERKKRGSRRGKERKRRKGEGEKEGGREGEYQIKLPGHTLQISAWSLMKEKDFPRTSISTIRQKLEPGKAWDEASTMYLESEKVEG